MRQMHIRVRKNLCRQLSGAAVTVVLLAGCGTGGYGNDHSGVAWKDHNDPSGFQTRLPGDWRVIQNSDSGQIEFEGVEEEKVTIWPVFVPANLDPRKAVVLLEKFTGPFAADVAWDPPQETGTMALHRAGHAPGRSMVSAVTWTASPKGSAAWLILASAPSATYKDSEEKFAGILRSFRLSGSAPPPEPALAYARWEDPNERAFSMEVPQNWRTSGGLIRNSSVDLRSAWESVSPEGDVRIIGGDAALPVFTEPSSMMTMGGFTEGTWYSPGYGVRMLVRRYLPGTVFLREYLNTQVAGACPELKLLDVHDRPDAVDALNRIYSQLGMGGIQMRISAGEAGFTCVENGVPMHGYYFAGTQRVQTAGMQGGIWNVEHLFGYIARESKEILAESVLAHILKTFQMSQQWHSVQQNITANTSEIVTRTQSEVSRIISDSYWNRQRSQDEIGRRRSNAILGLEDVVDPLTGDEMQIESGSNYYWVDHRGTIIGTETDTTPSIDFRELVRLP